MMKSFWLLVFAIVLASPGVFSQVISVIDEEDLAPVADVAIISSSGTMHTYTNRSGKADISAFPTGGPVCFQSISYERICYSTAEIKEMGFVVKLKRKVFAMEEFIVSATRWEQNIKEVPNRISPVLKSSIELGNPQTSADLIGLAEGVFIQKSQLGGGSPMIRGFATNRVLIVVDGVRMNNAIYREGNIHNVISVDPSSVANAEVIFGPGAIVYGSDAIGGVMDFHTTKALFSTGEKPYLKADALSRLSSASGELTLQLGVNVGMQKWAFMSSVSYSSYGDLRMGSHDNHGYSRPEYASTINGTDTVLRNPDTRVQVPTGYSQFSTLSKLRLKLSPDNDLVFALHYSEISDVPRYDRLIQYKSGRLRYGDWHYGPQTWLMNSLQLNLGKGNRLFSEARLTAAWQSYRESRHDRAFGSTSLNEQFEKVGAFSFNADFDRKTRSESQVIFYGLEAVYNDISSRAGTLDIVSGSATPAGSRYPNGKNSWTGISAYAGYRNKISELLSFTSGLRYNYSGLWSEIADNSFYNFPFTSFSITGDALTGAAGIVISPVQKLRITFNASTGFRAPNLDDAGKIFDSAPGVVVVPNPGLRPEYAWNIDAGISREFGNFLYADITGFFTYLDNAMVRHDFLFNGQDSIMYGGELSKVEAMTNTGSARVYGLQANIRISLAHYLRFNGSLNLTEGRESGGAWLRHAAPMFGSMHLVFDRKKLKADLYTDFNGSRKYEKMPPSELEKPYLYAVDANGHPWSPGWMTLNFKMAYTFYDWITMNCGVENILDLCYRPYSSGIASPGRNFIVSLRLAL